MKLTLPNSGDEARRRNTRDTEKCPGWNLSSLDQDKFTGEALGHIFQPKDSGSMLLDFTENYNF